MDPSPKSTPRRSARSRFTATDSGCMNLSSSGRNVEMRSAGGNDSITAEQLLESISYLEKDAALQKVNEELEKKSHEIFQKIEQYYSRKCVENRMSDSGDAHSILRTKPEPHPPEQNGKNCPVHHCSSASQILDKTSQIHKNQDLQIPTRLATAHPDLDLDRDRSHTQVKDDDDPLLDLDLEFDYEPQHHAKSVFSPSSPQSERSFTSEFCKKPGTAPGKASPDTKDVDIKARKRLQKATESVVHCLQSKLVNHEGRLADLYIQFRQKIQENTMLQGKIRALEDDREKLLKSLSNLQASVEKSAKGTEVVKNNLHLKTQAYTALKRDVEMFRRDQKQKAGVVQNLQTRLNRCLEENEKLKHQNRSLQQNYRDKHSEDRSQIEELFAKVCQLEQQKAILNATIGKQEGLVRTLRQQLK